jgi:probable F420-dependent oxidoreductase
LSATDVQFIYYFPGRWVPLAPDLLSLEAHAALVRSASDAGFDGLAVDEHPIPSETWRNGPGGHDALDPFITLASVAGVVPSMMLLTYLAVVPFRNPFLLAKQAATLDVLSGGRLILGVGTGYQEGEFQALGVEFDQRNALFDEGLEVMKRAWTGEVVRYQGMHFLAEDVRSLPVPVTRPHPPIWIGGNSKLTMRRVIDGAQGWMPMPNPAGKTARGRSVALETVQDLARLKKYLDEYAARQGRADHVDILCSATPGTEDPTAILDYLRHLAEIGVTWVSISGQGRSVPEARDWIAHFGAEVIQPFHTG